MKTVALFDVADQTFTFYTDQEWKLQIEDWRTDLRDNGYEADYLDVDEVVELTGGDEYFWDNIA
jgi:hypothetical protein